MCLTAMTKVILLIIVFADHYICEQQPARRYDDAYIRVRDSHEDLVNESEPPPTPSEKEQSQETTSEDGMRSVFEYIAVHLIWAPMYHFIADNPGPGNELFVLTLGGIARESKEIKRSLQSMNTSLRRFATSLTTLLIRWLRKPFASSGDSSARYGLREGLEDLKVVKSSLRALRSDARDLVSRVSRDVLTVIRSAYRKFIGGRDFVARVRATVAPTKRALKMITSSFTNIYSLISRWSGGRPRGNSLNFRQTLASIKSELKTVKTSFKELTSSVKSMAGDAFRATKRISSVVIKYIVSLSKIMKRDLKQRIKTNFRPHFAPILTSFDPNAKTQQTWYRPISNRFYSLRERLNQTRHRILRFKSLG